MGKGDKKTKRGKIFKGSFGISRKRKTKKAIMPSADAGAAAKEEGKKKIPKRKERPAKEE